VTWDVKKWRGKHELGTNPRIELRPEDAFFGMALIVVGPVDHEIDQVVGTVGPTVSHLALLSDKRHEVCNSSSVFKSQRNQEDLPVPLFICVSS
jgi:hypothetical protein